jgi:hypothetical protein
MLSRLQRSLRQRHVWIDVCGTRRRGLRLLLPLTRFFSVLLIFFGRRPAFGKLSNHTTQLLQERARLIGRFAGTNELLQDQFLFENPKLRFGQRHLVLCSVSLLVYAGQ